MNSKLPQYLWLIAVVLFVCLEIYHFIVGNYFDLIISLLIVIILLSMIGVFYLIKKFKGAELIQQGGEEMGNSNKENKNLIAYCGLYCGDCPLYKGKIADLARDLRKELRGARFDKTAEALSEISFFKTFNNYQQCYEVLGAMVKLRCRKVCKDGGGPPFCKIRKCCQKKGIDGCWECEEFETCEKLDFLKLGHGDAHIKNIRKIRKQGTEEFLKGEKYWYVKPK